MKFRALMIFTCTTLCLHTSSQNVAPSISDPDQLEITEQKKQVVFEQLFRDPTNLSLLFEYANLSILVGDLEAAIGVFEQMLIYDPALPRIRLELGVMYYRLGVYALANTYLKSVETFDPPLEVKARVDEFLKAIDTAREIFAWQQTLSLGWKHTTNGNSGINASFIEIGDLLLEVDPESKREGDRVTQYNYALNIDQDLNHPRGDNIQYFFNYGSERFNTFTQFNIQSNVLGARRNFNLDKNYFSFFNLSNPVFTPSFNLLRVLLDREEILRSGRIALDYSGRLDNGSSMLFSYYRDEKTFKSGMQKTGQVNGMSFGQTLTSPKSKAQYGYRVFLDNYRANVGYEFYENYGLELRYSRILKYQWKFSSTYSYQDKSHDEDYPLFGARHDQAQVFKLKFSKPFTKCWTADLGSELTSTNSSINIYKRSASNLSVKLSYQCIK